MCATGLFGAVMLGGFCFKCVFVCVMSHGWSRGADWTLGDVRELGQEGMSRLPWIPWDTSCCQSYSVEHLELCYPTQTCGEREVDQRRAWSWSLLVYINTADKYIHVYLLVLFTVFTLISQLLYYIYHFQNNILNLIEAIEEHVLSAYSELSVAFSD